MLTWLKGKINNSTRLVLLVLIETITIHTECLYERYTKQGIL